MAVERQRSDDQPDQAREGAQGSEELHDSEHSDAGGQSGTDQDAGGRTARDAGGQDADQGTDGQGGAAPTAPLSAAEAGKTALEQIVGLTGKPPAGIVSLQQAEGGWIVGVEVVEDSRVPSTADMLALYEVQVGNDRSLLGYKRTKRYLRSQAQGG